MVCRPDASTVSSVGSSPCFAVLEISLCASVSLLSNAPNSFSLPPRSAVRMSALKDGEVLRCHSNKDRIRTFSGSCLLETGSLKVEHGEKINGFKLNTTHPPSI